MMTYMTCRRLFTFFIVSLLSVSLLREPVLANHTPSPVPRPLPPPTDAFLSYMLAAFDKPDLLKTLAKYRRIFSHVGQPEPNSGKPNPVDVIHDADPKPVVLMYRLMNDITNGPSASSAPIKPFYKNGWLTLWNEWFEANLYEDIFLHAADPASVTFNLIANGKRIFWREDLRRTVKHATYPNESIRIDGYQVWRKRPGETAFTNLTPSPLPSSTLLFDDTTAPLDEADTYRIKTIINGTSADYSDDVTFANSAVGIFQPGFTVAIPADKTADGLHWLYGTPLGFTFDIKAAGEPDSVTLVFDQSRAKKLDKLVEERIPMVKAGTQYTAVADRTPPANYTGGYGFYFEAQKGSINYRLPGIGKYTTNINNRIRDLEWAGGYKADFSQPLYQQLFVKWSKDWIDKYHYDGVFLDVACRSRSGYPDAEPPGYNSSEYQTKMEKAKIDFLKKVNAELNPFHAIVNGGNFTFDLEGDPDSFPNKCRQNADGFLLENRFLRDYSHGGELTYFTDNIWKRRMNGYLFWKNDYYILIHDRFIPEDPQVAIPARLYALASYYLGKGQRSLYTFMAPLHVLPEELLDLGAPAPDPPYQPDNPIQAYAHPTQPGVYWRRFSKGQVYVNPSSTKSYTLTLPAAKYIIVPQGQGIATDGCLIYTRTQTISLPIHSGAILLNEIPASQSYDCSSLPGDIDGNGKVDIDDYNILVADFGKTTPTPADIDKNGKVDIFDYNILVVNFGRKR